MSFGRYVNSLGEEAFVAQTTNTFGTVNSGPLVGPVVISEIMYQPPPNEANTNAFLEYLELQNITTNAVPLFSPDLPLHTWHLRGAVQFDFPPNVTLASGQRVLVVGFDPVNDTAGLAAFCWAYPLATNIPLYGPWQGRLENSDERIELRKPGQLTGSGTVPSVLVDAVHYRSIPPWPAAAAGLGSSLQRLMPSAYGNDPTNWFAAGVSPGMPNFSNLPPTIRLTSPIDGQSVLYPDGLLMTAAAEDPDGAVVKVEFLADGAKLGEVTNAPFTLLWSNPPAGLHRLSAAARDDSGNYSFSSPLLVSVVLPAVAVLASDTGLQLAWPSNSGTFHLQSATNLLSPVFWLPVTNTPAASSNYWTIDLPSGVGDTRFYRLVMP